MRERSRDEYRPIQMSCFPSLYLLVEGTRVFRVGTAGRPAAGAD